MSEIDKPTLYDCVNQLCTVIQELVSAVNGCRRELEAMNESLHGVHSEMQASNETVRNLKF